jgi:hypothetical protein
MQTSLLPDAGVCHPLLCSVNLFVAMFVVLITQLVQALYAKCLMVDDSCCAFGGECRHNTEDKI